MNARALVSLASLLVLGACRCAPAPDVVVDAGPKAPPHQKLIPKDTIGGVYDANATPSARATELCDALHALPATRRATCCNEPNVNPGPGTGGALARTCAGVLTDAVAQKRLTLDDTAVTACIAARTQQLSDCGWIGLLPPSLPPECERVLAGALDTGAACKSSLECKPGLRCHGASPLDPGVCGPPGTVGSTCNESVDGLAVVVGQQAIDRDHPACDGACGLGRCLAHRAIGAGCMSDGECGDGNRCETQVCKAGRIAIGEKCVRGGCVDGARCMGGTCLALKKEREQCKDDLDCVRGGCSLGLCGMRCERFSAKPVVKGDSDLR